MRGWLLIVTVITAAVSVAGAARPAEACSFAGMQPYELAPSTDVTPPTTPTDGEVFLFAEQEKGCATSRSSCEGSGSISFGIGATDDVTAADDLGFVLRVVESSGQELFVEPGPFAMAAGVVIFFDPDEDLDAVIGVRAVDRAGNMSDELLVPVQRETEVALCGVSGRTRAALAPLVAGLLLITACRRRARGSSRRG